MSELKTSLLSIYYDSSFSGVYTAAHDLGIEWTVIKGISGYADGRNVSNSWRPFASLMAASLMAHILSDAIPFQDMPHYRNESKYGHAYISPITSLIVPVVHLLLKALVPSSLNLDFAAGVGVANQLFCFNNLKLLCIRYIKYTQC